MYFQLSVHEWCREGVASPVLTQQVVSSAAPAQHVTTETSGDQETSLGQLAAVDSGQGTTSVLLADRDVTTTTENCIAVIPELCGVNNSDFDFSILRAFKYY